MSGGVVGFDLGNRNCIICQAKRGSIDTVLNENSKRKTTSMVSFQGNTRFKGEAAVPIARSNYKNTVEQVKRLIGKSWSEKEVQDDIARMPYSPGFVELPNDKIGIKVNYNDEVVTFTPEEIMASVLTQLKETVKLANEGAVATDIVVSVPGYWTDRQRRAMLDACSIAQVAPLNLLNDHTAAALAYGIYKSARNMFDAEKKQYVMFIDVGHADTSVSISAFVQGKLQVVSTAYDPKLGGRDFDYEIMCRLADEFKGKTKLDVLSQPKAILKLLAACESAKQVLTPEGVNVAKVQVEFLMNEIDFKSELTLDAFQDMCKPLVDRLEKPIRQCLEESKLTVADLAAVEIIGGGTRPRCVKSKIAEVLGLDTSLPNYGLRTTLNADECIARGCALNSAMLSPQFRVKEFAVGDIVDFPIRLTWDQKEESTSQGDVMQVDEDADAEADTNSIIIMQRGTEIPKTRRVTFRRREPFQIVASYDDEAVKNLPAGASQQLSTYRVSGMPNNPDEEPPKIRVNARFAKDGTFSVVSAQLLEEVKPEPEEETKKAEEKSDKADAAKDESKEDAKETEKKETEEKPKEEKSEEPEKPKKKQYKRIELKVECSIPFAPTTEELKNMREREEKSADQDRLLAETSAMKNSLETYIYSTRDRLDMSLREFVTDEEREAFASKLADSENWLYDEGYDEKKEAYEKRLTSLQEVGNRYEARYTQQQERPQAQRAFSAAVNDFLAVVNSTDDQYSHLTDEEKQKVRKACDEATTWLDKQNAGQEKLPQTTDPVLTSFMIYEELRKLQTIANPIVTKKKPPPPKAEPKKEEEKKNDEKKEEETANADGNKDEPMPDAEPEEKKEAEPATEMETDLD